MTTVRESVPVALRAEVDAALNWFNQRQESAFEVTGIVDPERSLETGSPRDLHLVLCGGDECQQHSFRVAESEGGFDVALVGNAIHPGVSGDEIEAELDPPPGARRNWLAGALSRHAYVVLVFYRGFW